MRRRDQAGARWQLGEQSFTLTLPEAAVELHGIVDRIDEVDDDGETVLELIDYKAGSQTRWRDQAKLGFEDTQLAFYAALVGAETGKPVRAGYLPLEAREALAIERHKDVEASGRALVEGVAVDITRLRGGAALRALGRGLGVRVVRRARPVPSRRLAGRGAGSGRRSRRGRAMSEGPALRVDGERVSPARFYATACDPAKSVVVEACAGSGKTWMLVSRIVRLLLAGVEPHHILAITFTRAAAGEMRDRLAGWLAEWSMQASVEDRIRELGMRGIGAEDAARLEPALRALHGRLLDSGRPVAVLTFHAWFVQLLRLAPLEMLESLGLQPEMALIEDDVDLRAPVFRAFHAAVLRDPALRADYGALVATARPAHARTVAGPRLAAADGDRPGRRGRHARGQRRAGLGMVGRARGRGRPGAAGRRRCLARTTARAGRGLAAAQEQDAARGRGRDRCRVRAAGGPRARFEAIDSALLTQGGTVRKNLPESPALAEAGEFLSRLHDQVAQHDAHLEHRRMVRLARALLAAHAEHKRRHGFADMADLERLALAALRDADLAGWMQEKLDLRVRHLLIDEFQDTSPLAMARAACLAVVVRRGRRRRERAAAAEPLHRRRSEAEPLPLSRRRTARVRGGGRVRGRCLRRPPPRLRPHLAQRAARRSRRSTGSSWRPPTRASSRAFAPTARPSRSGRATASGGCRASPARRRSATASASLPRRPGATPC